MISNNLVIGLPFSNRFDPNTLQPIRGFSLHPERDAMTFVEDPAGYLEVLKKSVHFERDWSAKTTCGLVLTGTFITFVIPTGPAGTHTPSCDARHLHHMMQVLDAGALR